MHSLFLIRIGKEMAAAGKAFFLIICVLFFLLQPHMLVVCSFPVIVSLLMVSNKRLTIFAYTTDCLVKKRYL